jgi:GntR family transcriptional regulator
MRKEVSSGSAKPNLSQGSGGISRYIQLATLFRRHIASGTWPLGAQIPTVEELAAEHGVARATVRQALGILDAEQLIKRYRAKGTFVIHRPQEQLWCEVETNWDGLLRSREGAVIEQLHEEVVQKPAHALHDIGKPTGSYKHFSRRHWRDGVPFLISEVYIDKQLCKRIPKSSLATKTGLRILAEIPGLKIADVRQTLMIDAADPATAEKLQIPLNAPVAVVHRSAADSKGRLIFLADSVYPGNIVRLDMKLK